jgi:hypothetical protein
VVQNNVALRDEVMTNLDACLDSYGNMYQRLNIIIVMGGSRRKLPLLPANDADGSIRIQSSMNTYMTEIGGNEPKTALEARMRIENLNMFSLLIYNKFREYYNDYYMRRKLHETHNMYSPASVSSASSSAAFSPSSATTTGGKHRHKPTRKRHKYRTKTVIRH